MTTMMKPGNLKGLIFSGQMAADIMTPNVVSIHQQATVPEAVALLTDREISAVPVIDDAGRPVGVLSRTDIVRHDRRRPAFACSASNGNTELESIFEREWFGDDEAPDCTEVRDIMTPAVISVQEQDTALEVVAKMLAMKVHRVFVVDAVGTLIGVISTFDLLRKLRRKE